MEVQLIYEKIKLTEYDGLNNMKMYNGKDVNPSRLLFLEQPNGNMLYLGRISDVLERAAATDRLFGLNGDDLGEVSEPRIYDKLYIKIPPPQSSLPAGPPNSIGGRRRSKKYKVKRTRRYRLSKKR
jgi:hypothetical protein